MKIVKRILIFLLIITMVNVVILGPVWVRAIHSYGKLSTQVNPSDTTYDWVNRIVH